MSFAQNLKYLMSLNGLSGYRLAKDIGVSESTIGNWLKGETKPYNKVQLQLSEYFEIPVGALMGEELPNAQPIRKKRPPNPEGGGRSKADQAILDFLHSLPSKRLHGILLGLGAPEELLDALDRAGFQE